MTLIPADNIQSKGYTLTGPLAFVRERFGPDRTEQFIHDSTGKIHDVLSGSIFPTDWYPFTVQVALYEAIDKTFGSGDLELCREIGRYTAEHELSTVNRIFLKMGTPDFILKMAGMLWGKYYSQGKVEILKDAPAGSKGASLDVSRFNPISRAFCEDLSGWIQRTLELAGAKNVRVVHTQCLLDSAASCRFQGSWE